MAFGTRANPPTPPPPFREGLKVPSLFTSRRHCGNQGRDLGIGNPSIRRDNIAIGRVRDRMEAVMKYRVHRFDLKMSRDQSKLEQFLNNLTGEIVAIIPNVTIDFFCVHKVDFVLIVEKLA